MGGTLFLSFSYVIAKTKQFQGEIRAWAYDMKEHSEQRVQRYLELAKIPETKLYHRQTPCIDDHQLNSEDSRSFSGELRLRLCRLAQIGDEKSLAGGK